MLFQYQAEYDGKNEKRGSKVDGSFRSAGTTNRYKEENELLYQYRIEEFPLQEQIIEESEKKKKIQEKRIKQIK